MMQRVGLGQALMADPDLVVLDEPTDGVDPVGRRDIRDVLNRVRGQGKTVFINSHLLSELEMICDRVAILVQGRVAKQGTIDDLTAKSQRYDIEVDPGSGDGGLASLPARLGAALGLTFGPAGRDGAGTTRSAGYPQPWGQPVHNPAGAQLSGPAGVPSPAVPSACRRTQPSYPPAGHAPVGPPRRRCSRRRSPTARGRSWTGRC
jgi:hypothetical protein